MANECRPERKYRKPGGRVGILPAVHRTRPLRDAETGKLIGHACDCGRVLLTAAGNTSYPQRRRTDGVIVPRSNAHAARAYARRLQRSITRRVANRVKGARRAA